MIEVLTRNLLPPLSVRQPAFRYQEVGLCESIAETPGTGHSEVNACRRCSVASKC
jgi:hypothetical protein